MIEELNSPSDELLRNLARRYNGTSLRPDRRVNPIIDLLAIEPRRLPTSYAIAKQVFDWLAAAMFIAIISPLFLVIAALVKLGSPGPVFFSQERLGLGGRRFRCLKFRTMVANAEELLKTDNSLAERYKRDGFKIKDDPRVTPIGAWLRKTSLDELPQVINVLRGEMSVIGPRPIVPDEIARYGVYSERFLSVRPGLGGLWQAAGRSSLTNADRVELDMTYVARCGFVLDLKILLRTVNSVVRSRGAY